MLAQLSAGVTEEHCARSGDVLAIYHCSMKPISRGNGRSAVAAAAYRSGTLLVNAREGMVHDFRRRSGVVHAEIVVPEGSGADWALDRSALWNAAEVAEKRKDARVAREFELALPHELSEEQRLELVRDFARELSNRTWAAVDFAIHAPDADADVRNHHAHLLVTTRRVTAEGLSEKTSLERENKQLLAEGLPTTQMQLVEIRQAWELHANEHLARAGFEVRIDHRSHAERGLEIVPTAHVGVHATELQRRGQVVERRRLDQEVAGRNAELIREKPEHVLSVITGEKSVFDRHDIARALHRYIHEPEAFQASFAKVMASPALVELQAERRNDRGEVLELARFSTQEMVRIERGMAEAASRMAGEKAYSVSRDIVDRALAARPSLALEQRVAIGHVTGEERIAAVVGLAGAGKSTMLATAREAWEAQGYRVHGAALAGKAAEGLMESSGIHSRTLASWEYGWQAGHGVLSKGDILVIDEAGMVSSVQLARFIGIAERNGAKLVLVGDPEQLQPINAGAAFRAVTEWIGSVELEGVRRQQEKWQQAASIALGKHRTAEALATYADKGQVHWGDTATAARGQLVRDYLKDLDRVAGSRIALAHTRADVEALNGAIRMGRKVRGELMDERVYQTAQGERKFAHGDRLVFLENNRDLNVKNGMLGTVIHAREGRLSVELDGAAPGNGRLVSVSMADYAAVDHGYATTIHKAQGATVDRVYVLASGSMDRHLTYVALTRHRLGVGLYVGRDEFQDLGGLSSRLSRLNAKETTLDYSQEFLARRGMAPESQIRVSAKELPAVQQPRSPEPTPKPPALDKGTFAGLKLEAGHRPSPAPSKPRDRSPLEQALEAYAEAWGDVARMQKAGLPMLAHQKGALEKTVSGLEQVSPGTFAQLKSALSHDPVTARAMTDLVGPERAAALGAGLEREKVAVANPEIRAQRFVKQWDKLEQSHEKLEGWRHTKERGQVEEQLKSMAGLLTKDTAMATHLRTNAKGLGVKPFSSLKSLLQEKSPAQGITKILDRDRGMDIDF